MFRWYDHWLKGIDTGIMNEDGPIRVFVEGARRWRTEKEWPLKRTAWTKYYLRPRHRLAAAPEPLGPEDAPPDGFYQAPFTVTGDVQSVKWTTAPLIADTEITGPAALYVHAAIDTDDTNLIAKLYDVDPQGNRRVVSSGYLKASHRELDAAQSKPWRPHHPHTRSVPVPPGEAIEYAIRIYSFSNLFKAGHRIQLELMCNEPFADAFAHTDLPRRAAPFASLAAGHSSGCGRRVSACFDRCSGQARAFRIEHIDRRKPDNAGADEGRARSQSLTSPFSLRRNPRTVSAHGTLPFETTPPWRSQGGVQTLGVRQGAGGGGRPGQLA